jgi:hypothetical protein
MPLVERVRVLAAPALDMMVVKPVLLKTSPAAVPLAPVIVMISLLLTPVELKTARFVALGELPVVQFAPVFQELPLVFQKFVVTWACATVAKKNTIPQPARNPAGFLKKQND